MKYITLLILPFALSCAKVDPTKIDRLPVTDAQVVSQEHLSGVALNFEGNWQGTGNGQVIQEKGLADVSITVAQADGTLTVNFEGVISHSTRYQYNFGKFKINGNTLIHTSSDTSLGTIGRKAFVLHDSKNAAHLQFRRDDSKAVTFRLQAQERLPTGKFVQYHFEGRLGL